ncbi:phage minor structural protein, N-terminal region [Alkalithermobacter thermoalcaliphilus JW-YL-7 = DSM 7308]|uniref:Phage minor structural protein n=1 Tax=Alkalithermobacter thermoalcaliphilus JW-YL-7 = DSM 7308 TaxID=1121328 RepID=A0A150FQX6_CLOPD|nr:phage minor structural protein [[Clostridium] paradoxum JW-YL-7 = DSM 7308]SHL13916.1 phage minor structural protein, N-terminal region [[Clostridium] paradoxum JW-YL-7 = DSM 7308]
MNYAKIFNSQGKTLVILDNFVTAKIKKQINGEYIFEFTTILEELKTEYIHHNNYIEVDNQFFQIAKYEKERTSENKLFIHVLCEQVSYKLIDYIVPQFIFTNATAQALVTELLKDTEFNLVCTDVTKRIDINITTEKNKRELLHHLAKRFDAEINYDKYNIYFLKKIGRNDGLQFRLSKNLKGIKKLVDNIQRDTLGNPYITYEVDLLDLSEIDEFKDIEKFELGDEIRVIDEDLDIDVNARIVEIEYNPIRRRNTRVVLSNLIQTFADLTHKIREEIEQNNSKLQVVESKIIANEGIIENLIATKADIADLNTASARIDNLEVNKANVSDLTAVNAQINNLQVNKANVADIQATNARIDNLRVTTTMIDDLAVTTAKIGDGQITSAKIEDGSITNAKIANSAITNAKIANATIQGAKIANATIDTANIKDSAITNAKIANGSIDTAKIANASITTAKITTGAITTALIESGAVGTAQIADGSITDAKIVSLTANKITSGTIDASRVNVINLKADNIVAGALTIDGDNLIHNTNFINNTSYWTISANKWVRDTSFLYDNTVTMKSEVTGETTNKWYGLFSEFIPATEGRRFVASVYSYTTNKSSIDAGAAVELEWYNNDNSRIAKTGASILPANNNVWQRFHVSGTAPAGTTKVRVRFHLVKNGIIWIAKPMLQRGSIASEWKLHTDEQISTGAITSDKIADNSITENKIPADTIKNTHISANAITGDKIVAGTITGGKIASNTITANNIASNTITAGSAIIADGAITNAKIANLDAAKITSGFISADRIQARSISVDKLSSNVGSSLDISSNIAITQRVTSETFNAGIAEAKAHADARVDGIEIGGRNLLRNSNFQTGDLTRWANWGTCQREIVEINGKYWVHLTQNDTADWRGIQQTVRYFEKNTPFTISFTAFKTDLYEGGARVLFHQVGADGNNPQPRSEFPLTNEPKRYTFSFTSTDLDKDSFNVMIGGEPRKPFDIYITDIKFEKGNKATDWTPAPEDVDEEIQAVRTYTDTQFKDAIEHTNITASEVVTNMQSEISQTSDAIIGTVSSQLIDLRDDLTTAYRSEIKSTAQSLNLEFSQMTGKLSDVEGDLSNVKSYFNFSQQGLTIGKSTSPLQISISNEQMSFLDNGQVAAYVNGQKMYIKSLHVLNSAVIGSHIIEKYNDDMTFFKWVGGN